MPTPEVPKHWRNPDPAAGLTLTPIGYIRTQKHVKFQARHQPLEAEPEQNILELLPNCGYELALQDLSAFSRIWVVWWFHLNPGWRPLVLPPRGPSRRRGVFATRSPHRPNPIGITPVPLVRVEGRRLILGPCDFVDGTPVFDLKPYYAPYDSFPDATGGWIAEVEAEVGLPPKYVVEFGELAIRQAEWLEENWRIDFRARLAELLGRDPTPHRTRRIRRLTDSVFQIGCGAWRALFQVSDLRVHIVALEAAYALRFLLDPARQDIPDASAQLAFLELWPERPPRNRH
jgi:tRNA-Thr(GGU) m(6)t(6)A37 methyltransferase TsaA